MNTRHEKDTVPEIEQAWNKYCEFTIVVGFCIQIIPKSNYAYKKYCEFTIVVIVVEFCIQIIQKK